MDVFISYRRSSGYHLAKLLKEKLENDGITTFFDKNSIKKGKNFLKTIENNIASCSNVLVLVADDYFDRCKEKDDIVRMEIKEALRLNKNIIPILYKGTNFPKKLTKDIDEIRFKNAETYIEGEEDALYASIIADLKTDNGLNLVEAKKQADSNSYYSSGISEEEKDRIIKDRLVCKKYEDEVLSKVFSKKKNVIVFNPAVYEASSVVEKYSIHKCIKKVYGFIPNVVDTKAANKKYSKNNKYKFYTCNFEDDDFFDKLDKMMQANKIDKFDFIDLTLVLKDSNKPFSKLQKLSNYMNKDSIIFVRELDHSLAIAYPDSDKKFEHMMDVLKRDKYSGSSNTGRKILNYLKRLNVKKVYMHDKLITTANMSSKERSDLFDVYFSYVPPEINSMIEEDPLNDRAVDDKEWLITNYDELKCRFLSQEFLFISGFMIYYAIMN